MNPQPLKNVEELKSAQVTPPWSFNENKSRPDNTKSNNNVKK